MPVFGYERVVHEDVYCSRYESIVARILHRCLKVGAASCTFRTVTCWIVASKSSTAIGYWLPDGGRQFLGAISFDVILLIRRYSIGPNCGGGRFSGTTVLDRPAVVVGAPDPPDDPGTSSSGPGGS
jgi:hypothetical protein